MNWNWNAAWLTTKVTLCVIIDLLLVIGTVVLSVTAGSLVMLLLDAGVLGALAGLLSGVTMYFAGTAGRHLAMATTIGRILFSDDERSAIRVIALEEQKKEKDKGKDE